MPHSELHGMINGAGLVLYAVDAGIAQEGAESISNDIATSHVQVQRSLSCHRHAAGRSQRAAVVVATGSDGLTRLVRIGGKRHWMQLVEIQPPRQVRTLAAHV